MEHSRAGQDYACFALSYSPFDKADRQADGFCACVTVTVSEWVSGV